VLNAIRERMTSIKCCMSLCCSIVIRIIRIIQNLLGSLFSAKHPRSCVAHLVDNQVRASFVLFKCNMRVARARNNARSKQRAGEKEKREEA